MTFSINSFFKRKTPKDLLRNLMIPWLESLYEENIPDEIIALNFGLFERPSGYAIYLIGSKKFDPNEDDWACYEDFTPTHKYLEIENSDLNKLEWNIFLSVVKETLLEIIDLPQFKESSINKVKHITTGFDDGDLERIK